jgi:ssDNA-binding replication factor A large subunit
MNIRDLKDGMQRVDVVGIVTSVGDAREVKTKRGPMNVADAALRDDTGEVGLTLWGDQIDQVAEGAKVQVKAGAVRTFGGKLQLSTFGENLAVLDQTAGVDEPPPLTCPSCGFSAEGFRGAAEWRFCPVDGEALG